MSLLYIILKRYFFKFIMYSVIGSKIEMLSEFMNLFRINRKVESFHGERSQGWKTKN
jgi:hypothetical protein